MKTLLPYISIITPCYNEEALLESNIIKIHKYLESIKDKYQSEIIIVNDGSKDQSGEIAEDLSKKYDDVKVIHHPTNKNLGSALKTGFVNASGEYIVVLDIDLSYSEDHIEKLVDKIIEEKADIVIASPYIKNGKVTKVPFIRKLLSKYVNKLISMVAQTDVHTFTGMVRAYRTEFVKTLNLKGTTHIINPEIIYKGIILRARIIEIPAHLDWSFMEKVEGQRTSSMKVFKGIFKGLMSAFVFRPYAFFFFFGGFLFVISAYIIVWIFINVYKVYPMIQAKTDYFDDRFGQAVAQIFAERPYSFYVGGITLIVALQFLSIGFLSLQSKRNFEETYHFNTTIYNEILSLKKLLKKN